MGLVLAVDGLASVWLVGKALAYRAANRSHAEFDSLLGWINRKNFRDPDYYGDGAGVSTNSQRLRGTRDYPPSAAGGKIRVVCLGDSFTFGHGVGDDETWPAQLAQLDDRLETVNMGQTGVGLDYLYLWYRRDGDQLKHHVALLAMIDDDYYRMADDGTGGYPKPFVELTESGLRVQSQPLERPSWHVWFSSRAAAFDGLRSLSLARTLIPARSAGSTGSSPRPPRWTEGYHSAVTLQLFTDFRRLADARGSRAAIVYLPTRADLFYHVQSRASHRRRYADLATRAGIRFLDLTEPMRALPELEQQALFLDQSMFWGTAHYSSQGNALVGKLIYSALLRGSLPGEAPR